MYDSNVGRWLSKDPRHQYWSPYEGMGNNPISGTDPTGGWDEEAPPGGGPVTRDQFGNPTSGNNLFSNANKTSSGSTGSNASTTNSVAINGGEVANNVQTANDIVKVALVTKAVPAVWQTPKVLRAAGAFDNVGTVATGATIAIDIYSLQNGDLSQGEFAYRTTGNVSSIVIPALLTASGTEEPISSLVGVGIGAAFQVAPYMYDRVQWWTGEMSNGLTNYTNDVNWIINSYGGGR
jgi:hypothetical protein